MKFTTINLLDELERPEFSNVLSEFQQKTFHANTIIFEPSYDELQWSKPAPLALEPEDTALPQKEYTPKYNYVFIVKSGRIRVHLSYGEKEFTVAILQPGDVYVSHSNAFVTTLEKTSILLINTQNFIRLMTNIPQFSIAVVKVLGGILKNTFTIIDGLALRDTSGRLARFLLENAHFDTQGQEMVQLGLTGEILAQMLGTSRQTLSTLLTDLVRAGILQKEGRGVYRILDKNRLRELVI